MRSHIRGSSSAGHPIFQAFAQLVHGVLLRRVNGMRINGQRYVGVGVSEYEAAIRTSTRFAIKDAPRCHERNVAPW